MQKQSLQKKRALRIALLVLLLNVVGIANAQVSTWDGTWEPWTHGTGTEADPFLIENAQQLAYLAYRVNNGLDANGGHVSNHDYHYKLMVDVDLNGSEDFQWRPIGYWNSNSDYQCFGGRFHGNNHTISNLYINSASNRIGFCGFIDGATFENITLLGATIHTTGLNVGGLIGVAQGETDIINCCNSSNITSAGNAGGILGLNTGIINITNCHNTGNVSGSSCGGLLGSSNSNSASAIGNCYNIGEISGIISCGGIMGSSNNVTINNCYNFGNINGNSHYQSDLFCGGIGGDLGNATIFNCYNIGNINASNSFGSSYVITGCIVARSTSTAINCYYLNSCGGNNYWGGQPMSADAMETEEFVDMLNDGTCAWVYDYNNTNLGYPILTMIIANAVSSEATHITQTHATLHGSLTIENASVLSQGFEYKKVSDNHFQIINVSGSGNISTTLSGLEPNTQYQYHTFCTLNDCGTTYYGEEKTFTTLPVSVTTNYATDVTANSAVLHGYMDIGDATLVSKGFEYRADGETAYTTVNVVGNNNDFNTQITGLQLNTTYEYRAFMNIAESSTTYYGTTRTFEVTWLNQDTICVYNAEMLRWVSEQCNSGTTFQGKYIKLMNDIVLPENVPNNMTSIGSYPNYPFKGTFDGNGKHITNLYIDQPNTPYQGFFGYTLNANLYNVGLVNITASGRNYTGGMVAYAENTYLRDCYVNGGTLFALSYCGGLVGYQEQGTNSIISGCYNTCEVTGNNYVGGLVGFSNYSTVRNSYVAAMVAAQGEAVGSIIGGANEVLMYYCYFNSELTGQTNAIGWNNTGKDGGEAMTSAQMRDPQFVATLNQGLTVHVWKQDYTMHINNGFPILQWQQSTGVDENEALAVSIYPNPTNGHVTIEAEDFKNITITNMLGQVIYDNKAEGDTFEYDFCEFGAGIYFLKIETVNGVVTRRVSVTR